MSWSTDPDTDLSATLQFARDYFIEHPPAGFLAQSSRDQAQKLRKRQVMETNWNAYIEDCVPEEIKPRQIAYKGHKVKVGEETPAMPWWQWSMKFMIILDRLSGLTKGKLMFAQELMLLEVSKRHKDMTNRDRQCAGIIAQDLELIVAALLKRLETSAIEVSEGEESENEPERDIVEKQPYIKTEDPNEISFAQTEGFDEPLAEVKREAMQDADEVVTPSPRKIKKNHAPAKIATLRAKAMRHKEQASRLEAEAYELEAKHLSEQA